MNTLNELVTTMVCAQQPVKMEPPSNTVTKEELEKALAKVQEKLEKLEKNVLTKNGYDLHNHIRLNRPLKWKYKWNGEKKYATLDKERLEFWHDGWEQWRTFNHHEAADTNPRIPK